MYIIYILLITLASALIRNYVVATLAENRRKARDLEDRRIINQANTWLY